MWTRNRAPDRLVFVALAMVLLLAAILKIGDIRSEGWADNAGTFTIAMGEVALAGWLLSGRRPAFAWVATIITFAVFALVAASKAAAGESSCGCFGQVRADPWWALVLDMLAIAALATWPPPAAAHRWAWVVRASSAGTAVVIAALGLGAWGVATRPATVLSSLAQAAGAGPAAPADASRWVGLRFPLLGKIDTAAPIDQGLWVVVLHTPRCLSCTREVPKYMALAEHLAAGGSRARVALIRLRLPDDPSANEPGSQFNPDATPVASGQIASATLGSYEINVPTTFVIDDGLVRSVSTAAVR